MTRDEREVVFQLKTTHLADFQFLSKLVPGGISLGLGRAGNGPSTPFIREMALALLSSG